MATCTIYPLCSFDKDNYSIAITGNIKIKVRSQLDNDVGESQKIITPKLVKGKTDNKVLGRLLTIITGLEYMKRLKVSSADRSYLWTIDRETVDLINKNSPLTMIETLKGMDIPEETATQLSGKLYGMKMELGTRIGYQDKTKTNRFIDMAQKMLAEQSAPAIPDWSEALEKAKRKAQMETIKTELNAMEEMNNESSNDSIDTEK
jgi:hypothetical protein